MMRRWQVPILVCAAVGLPFAAAAQAPTEVAATGGSGATVVRPEFEVEGATSAIKVDGVLDEQAWQDAAKASLIYEWFPGDNTPPPVETDSWVTFDADNVYFAFKAWDPEPEKVRATLMDRDDIDTFVQNDYVFIMIDTFNDDRRGFQFRVNPFGVQADAIFSESEGIEDFSWDIIWKSAGRLDADGFTVEIALPVNQLRFPSGAAAQTWGIAFGRSYPRSSRHRIAAHPIDRNNSCVLCQMAKVTGFEGLEPGRNLELNPTLTAGRTDEREELPDGPLEDGDPDFEPGLTVRWGITPNINLLGTLNPDFSQVEADAAQLAVNERFALFFPEKRPFFLEAIDIFQTPIDSVFTRTVVSPDWGLKLTGKTGRNVFGLFSTQDTVNSLIFPSNQRSEQTLIEGEEVLANVVRYRRDVGRASTVGVLFAGREGEKDYYNRVGGVDAFVRASDADTVSVQYLYSDTHYDDGVAEEFAQPMGSFSGDAFDLEYQHIARKWLWTLEYRDYDSDFRADSGFVPRVDIVQGEAEITKRFWGAEDDWYDRIDVTAEYERTEDHDGQLTDESMELESTYLGPAQSVAFVKFTRAKQFFGGVLYEDLDTVDMRLQFQPGAAGKLSLFGRVGDSIDFSNNQPADEVFLNGNVELKLGRRVNAQLDHVHQELDVAGGRLFTADLSQLRLVYSFNVRSFVRGIFQYLDLERDPELYSMPVEKSTETFFTQLLFSYKVNPLTVLFVGYSENQLGLSDFSLTETDRTLFVKLGYAFLL